jgi:hypothetical protein
MTDHDHSTCDALPLAVALTQLQARYNSLEAVAAEMAEALGIHAEQFCNGCGEVLEKYTAWHNNGRR